MRLCTTAPGPAARPARPAAPVKSALALSRWKKLTGTAMFINRLGKGREGAAQTLMDSLLPSMLLQAPNPGNQIFLILIIHIIHISRLLLHSSYLFPTNQQDNIASNLLAAL